MFKLILLAAIINISFAYDYFTIWKGKVYDPNGKEFLVRGINSVNADYDSYDRYFAKKSFASIAKTGANTVRVQWRINSAQGLNVNVLDGIIQEAVNQKLVVMLQLHDATGSSNVQDLLRCAAWWKTNANVLLKYKKYLMVNIANEWSPYGTSLEVWRDAYISAIKTVRESGWGGPLVVDASAYAQNSDGPLKYGLDIINADNWKNVIFSVHMYAEWKTNGGRNIASALQQFSQKQIPLIIGEFALKHPEGCNWIDINAKEIMKQCQSLGIGYIGWSWLGNGKGDCNYDLDPLNIVKGNAQDLNNWIKNDYTEWGNVLVNDANGIKATSKKASIY